MANDTVVTLSDWSEALTCYGGESAAYVADNPKLLSATFDFLKSVSERHWSDAVADGVGVAGAAAEKVEMSKNARFAVQSTTFVVSEAKLTMSLRVLAAVGEGSHLASPAAAVSLIGATLVTKAGQAMGLAGSDNERSKCVGALMEVAGNVGVTAVTFETGVGAVLGVVSIGASALNAYMECR